MFPWLFNYAPQYQLPWSGNWAQTIDPDTSFFSSIKPGAGVGEIERKATDVASYGSQLGWLAEILLANDVDERGVPTVSAEDVASARLKLRTAYKKIRQIKEQNQADVRQSALTALERLRTSDPAGYSLVLRMAALEAPAAEASGALTSATKAIARRNRTSP